MLKAQTRTKAFWARTKFSYSDFLRTKTQKKIISFISVICWQTRWRQGRRFLETCFSGSYTQPWYTNVFLPRINTRERLWFEKISEEQVSGCVSEKQLGKRLISGKWNSCAWVVAGCALLWQTRSYAEVNQGTRLTGTLMCVAIVTTDTAEGSEHGKQEWLTHLTSGQWEHWHIFE